MTVHLFGAGSSHGCCNFALKKTAEDYEKELGSEPAEFLRRDFYVDDGLRDQATPSQWRHVETKSYPADDASRGITAKEQVESSRWISGPKFLWKPEGLWPQPSEDQDLINHQQEIRGSRK